MIINILKGYSKLSNRLDKLNQKERNIISTNQAKLSILRREKDILKEELDRLKYIVSDKKKRK